jgi:hypothetical protein
LHFKTYLFAGAQIICPLSPTINFARGIVYPLSLAAGEKSARLLGNSKYCTTFPFLVKTRREIDVVTRAVGETGKNHPCAVAPG